MKQAIAATWKPMITRIDVPGRRYADKIRAVAGSAIDSVGADVSLPDRIPALPSPG
jgi:hypothetical protein